LLVQLDDFPDDVVAVRAAGRFGGHDYADTLVPALTAALGRHQRVRLLLEVSPEVTGHVAPLVLHEAHLGLEHPERWDRIAFVGDPGWLGHLAWWLGLLVSGTVRAFTWAEREQAERWIRERSEPGAPRERPDGTGR
jgi:hypothetical protein